MLLDRLGLHQCQAKYGQPVRPTGRLPFEGACQGSHRPSLSKASPFLTGPVWPLSVASTAWLAAWLVTSGNSNAVRSIFTTLKGSKRGGSRLRLCCQWTFTPKNLLGIGRDWKNGWMFAVCSRTLRRAPSNHVVCIRCLCPQESIQAQSPPSKREKKPGRL